MYKQLPQKDVKNLEKQEKKKQLSGYKQCYTYKDQSFEVSKYRAYLISGTGWFRKMCVPTFWDDGTVTEILTIASWELSTQ